MKDENVGFVPKNSRCVAIFLFEQRLANAKHCSGIVLFGKLAGI